MVKEAIPFHHAVGGGADQGKEDIAPWEVRLKEREALPNAKEKDVSFWKGNLEATLHGKDEEQEALIQQRTNDLEDSTRPRLMRLPLNPLPS